MKGWKLIGVSHVNGVIPEPGIRLPLHLKQMGDPEHCGHRSGWRFVMDHLRQKVNPLGILVDDFVERTFQHDCYDQEWQEPWIGIFHHPPNLPGWFDPSGRLV
jgi:hypothetical protein